jgi:hypothetical protein
MVGSKDDVPIMSLHTDAWSVQPNPEGTPAKGGFTTVCADPAGNLFVGFEDENNPKKKKHGLMRRVNGAWSTMPELPKGWSGVYDPVAAGPDKLWFHSKLSEESRSVLAHWNGTEYATIAMPEHMKELHTLFLDADGALLTDGDMGDKEGVYRFANGAWQPMGEALDVLRVERFVRLSDGTLVCLVDKYDDETHALFQWRGMLWLPLPGAEVANKRSVEDLCAGPDGRLFLLIKADEEEGDPQRLACWQNGTLHWRKGSEANAVLKEASMDVDLLACDRTGVLQAREYDEQHAFPRTEFEWSADGYLPTDARAAEVWTQFKTQQAAYMEKATPIHDAYRKLANDRSPLNALEVGTRYNEWYQWLSTSTDAFVDLVPKGANRLVDRYRAQLKTANEMYAAMRTHASAVGRVDAGADRLNDQVIGASRVNKETEVALDAEILAYPLRNGLDPLPVRVAKDPYPAKDVKAAEVLAVLNANKAAYNGHVATCRTYVAGVDRLNGAAAFHLEHYVEDSLITWVASVNKQLDALAVPAEQNRLQDSFRNMLNSVSNIGYALEAYAGLRTSNSTAEQIREQSDRLDRAQQEVTAAITAMNKVYSAYLVRNGL